MKMKKCLFIVSLGLLISNIVCMEGGHFDVDEPINEPRETRDQAGGRQVGRRGRIDTSTPTATRQPSIDRGSIIDKSGGNSAGNVVAKADQHEGVAGLNEGPVKTDSSDVTNAQNVLAGVEGKGLISDHDQEGDNDTFHDAQSPVDEDLFEDAQSYRKDKQYEISKVIENGLNGLSKIFIVNDKSGEPLYNFAEVLKMADEYIEDIQDELAEDKKNKKNDPEKITLAEAAITFLRAAVIIREEILVKDILSLYLAMESDPETQNQPFNAQSAFVQTVKDTLPKAQPSVSRDFYKAYKDIREGKSTREYNALVSNIDHLFGSSAKTAKSKFLALITDQLSQEKAILDKEVKNIQSMAHSDDAYLAEQAEIFLTLRDKFIETEGTEQAKITKGIIHKETDQVKQLKKDALVLETMAATALALSQVVQTSTDKSLQQDALAAVQETLTFYDSLQKSKTALNDFLQKNKTVITLIDAKLVDQLKSFKNQFTKQEASEPQLKPEVLEKPGIPKKSFFSRKKPEVVAPIVVEPVNQTKILTLKDLDDALAQWEIDARRIASIIVPLQKSSMERSINSLYSFKMSDEEVASIKKDLAAWDKLSKEINEASLRLKGTLDVSQSNLNAQKDFNTFIEAEYPTVLAKSPRSLSPKKPKKITPQQLEQLVQDYKRLEKVVKDQLEELSDKYGTLRFDRRAGLQASFVENRKELGERYEELAAIYKNKKIPAVFGQFSSLEEIRSFGRAMVR